MRSQLDQQRRVRQLKRVAIYGIGAGLAYLGFCWVAAYQYVHPLRRTVTVPLGLVDTKIHTAAGYSPTFVTRNLMDGSRPDVVFVLAHGYGGSRNSFDELMLALEKRGYGAIAPAMPGQEASADASVGFGSKEANVMLAAVGWVRSQYKQKPPRIVLYGISMGGAAAWLASQRDPTVDAVVTEGAYANFDEAAGSYLSHRVPGGNYLLAPVFGFARMMTRLDPSRLAPLEAARQWRGRPALIIHGDQDRLIGLSHAVRLSIASGARLWRIPTAGHVMGYRTDPNAYLKELDRIAAEIQKLPPASPK